MARLWRMQHAQMMFRAWRTWHVIFFKHDAWQSRRCSPSSWSAYPTASHWRSELADSHVLPDWWKASPEFHLSGRLNRQPASSFDDKLLCTVSLQSWKEKRFTFSIDLTSVVDLGCLSWIGIAPSRILGRKIPDLNPHQSLSIFNTKKFY